MTYDINIINLEVLKQNYNNLQSNYEYFKRVTREKFINSYLNKCSNPSLKVSTYNLNLLYDEIDKNYQKLLEWFSKYIHDVEALEANLSGNNVMINDSTVRYFVESKLKSI